MDFDYAKSEDLTMDKLNEYLDESHAHTKKIFNEVITKEYLQVMRGEAIYLMSTFTSPGSRPRYKLEIVHLE